MRTLWNKLLCWFGYHAYYKTEELSDYSIKVGCFHCSKMWGMHLPTKTFIEWDKDLEAIYATKVLWEKKNNTD